MADEINYDYESMDNAYEAMKGIGDRIKQACDDMSSDALRMLSSNGGDYAEKYQIKLNKLNTNIDELNSEMTTRAALLQQEFDRMGQTDIKLGAGF